MDLSLLRTLQLQRSFYDMPRDMQRFRAYLAEMTGGSDDIALPIGAMNPMGKDKAKAAYEALLAIQAEDVAEAALATARPRLAAVPGTLKVALVVLDDAQGWWSQPDQTEEAGYLNNGLAKRGFSAPHFLSSRAPYTADQVRQAVLADVFQQAAFHQRGAPRTLADLLAMTGFRDAFAGRTPRLDPPGLAEARRTIAAHLSAPVNSAAAFALMFGDESARTLGLEALGVPERAGFEVALAQAQASGKAPEHWLLAT